MRVSHSTSPEKLNVFILHCGLDIKKVERSCEKADLPVNLIIFRREEVFSYFVRLGRPHPDLIIIRSHFRSLLTSLKQVKQIPTIVVSTHGKPQGCLYPFIRARHGYDGPDTFKLYAKLALCMSEELSVH
jgi:hypothetical protein